MSQFIKFSGIMAVVAMLTFATGSAFAEPKISGGADASFGTYSYSNGGSGTAEKKASGFAGHIQANVILSGGEGPVDYYVRLRVRDEIGSGVKKGEFDSSSAGLQTARVRLRYKATDTFAVSVGKMPGIGGTGIAGTQPGRALVRVENDNAGFYDNPGITLEFNNGMIKAGLAIGTACQQACAKPYTGADKALDTNKVQTVTPLTVVSAAVSSAATVTPAVTKTITLDKQQTMMPYVQVKMEDLGLMVGFRLANDTAEHVDKSTANKQGDLSVEASTMALDVAYTIADIGKVAFEYAAIDLPVSTVKGGATTALANPFYKKNKPSKTIMVLGFSGMGIGFSYSTSTVDWGKNNDSADLTVYNKPGKTVMALSYMVPMGGGKIGGAYAASSADSTIAEKDNTGAKTTNKVLSTKTSEMRFVVSSGF